MFTETYDQHKISNSSHGTEKHQTPKLLSQNPPLNKMNKQKEESPIFKTKTPIEHFKSRVDPDDTFMKSTTHLLFSILY